MQLESPGNKTQPSCRTAALTWKIFRGNRVILVVRRPWQFPLSAEQLFANEQIEAASRSGLNAGMEILLARDR